MAKKAKTLPGRRPRADAERNRALLLEAAKVAFAQKGSGASLEDIARNAAVGIGTLYRHFPTREALIEAVYSNEADQLIKAASRLAKSKPPVAALREWLLMFVEYIITKHGLSEVLKSISGGSAYTSSSGQVKQAIVELVDRAIASGDVRLEIEPMDLLRALYGVANLSVGPDSKRAAKHMVDVLVAGIRIQR